MRLKKIKLVGFKSFVDPTSVYFPGQLVAVVGPNGCGKSNTIDAVRWVMGESSAKNLRGESMTDVIFNGSLNRKPVGQAAVELIFDNDAGRAQGAYAGYREISIKRIVTRDSQSLYYLNGTKCRKKDVTDLFLGTGLGPRSYSIIGQGTISRVIEAKPEELRVFLEEAAGISKYKERRKETENRMRHTRENLERVDDIREELGKQLERLQRQANAAARYTALKQQERLTQAQWHALKWRDYDIQLRDKESQLSLAGLKKEQCQTEVTHLETQLEARRSEYNCTNDQFLSIQGDFYRIGGEIARLEQSLQHQKQRNKQYQQDLAQAKSDWQTATDLCEQDRLTIEQLNQEVEILHPKMHSAHQAQAKSQQILEKLEEQLQQWQSVWEAFNLSAHESSKQAHVEQANIQHIEQQLQKAQTRIEKLHDEQQEIDLEGHRESIDELLNLKTCLQETQQELNAQAEEKNAIIKELKTSIAQQEQLMRAEQDEVQSLKAEIKSLETLQQDALGKQDKQVRAWLEDHQLLQKTRLAECLSIEETWQQALEVVLSDELQALCLEQIDTVFEWIHSFEQGSLCFIDEKDYPKVQTLQDLPTLAGKLKAAPACIFNRLSSVYAVESMDEAVALLPQIGTHESIITLQGVWLGQSWIKINQGKDPAQNILFREQVLRHTKKRLTTHEQHAQLLESQLQTLKEQLSGLEHERQCLSERIDSQLAILSENKATLTVKQSQLEQWIEKEQSLANEIADYQTSIEDLKEQLYEAKKHWQQAMQAMEGDTEKRHELSARRDELQNKMSMIREQFQQERECNHQLQLSLKTKQSQLTQLQQNVSRESGRIDKLSTRIEQLVQDLSEQASPEEDTQEQLDQKLLEHLQLEEKLNERKALLESSMESIKDFELTKQQAEHQLNDVNACITQLAMDAQTLKVRCATVIERLEDTDYALNDLIDSLPEGAIESVWQQQLQEIQQKIQRLGAINLAAIDEYQIESERKSCLDQQYDDLVQALETLEAAIHKIDKETRARFKETFNRVNQSFTQLFPRLFGGGDAYLALTGDDLLDTGVTVMARPPGKRNSSIHLLSGGEKAMAAVALVFAIFKLNPSPFCMLDEVDAPLDDANVSRFCGMVKEMSETVQFIFITHNKVTMELADHLSGVTMNEPGVSRIVSVDVDEAISISQVDEVREN